MVAVGQSMNEVLCLKKSCFGQCASWLPYLYIRDVIDM